MGVLRLQKHWMDLQTRLVLPGSGLKYRLRMFPMGESPNKHFAPGRVGRSTGYTGIRNQELQCHVYENHSFSNRSLSSSIYDSFVILNWMGVILI